MRPRSGRQDKLLALFLCDEDWKTEIQQYWKYTLYLFPLAVKSCSRITRTVRPAACWELEGRPERCAAEDGEANGKWKPPAPGYQLV
ncbi:hypothetical protein AV530_007139 [Patagioenas fasciata monilis]|uniref:Uncharacterized protein n=1 Tax=Patagioenas fasciata monilis TaxID=372326 RepID=A0A1V4L0B0_PATFA|nr:hypothetical protein AV530_007139 [Patagioenas fasciata monilis]